MLGARSTRQGWHRPSEWTQRSATVPERAAAVLSALGPNALPEEEAEPGWLRFADLDCTHMQLILIGAAIVSAAAGGWNTAILLVALTLLYAVEQGRKIFDDLTKYICFVLVLLFVFVLTFLGASTFDIAAGAFFDPARVLWFHFFVNAAFGFVLTTATFDSKQ